MHTLRPLLIVSLASCTIQHYHPTTPSPPAQRRPGPSAAAKKPATAAKPKPTATKRPQNSRSGVASRIQTRRHVPTVKKVKRIPPPPSDPSDVIIAPPPSLAFSEQDLGTPYTADFRAYRGPDGRSVFPNGKIFQQESTRYESSVFAIETEQELRAHAGAWGVQLSGSTTSATRFAAQRALQIDRCSAIDDRTAVRNAPPAAIYYPAVICFGHRYEAVLEGNMNRFTAGVKASFLIFSAGVEAFAEQHKLTLDIKADGLKRKPGCSSLTFKNPADFEACFEPAPTTPTPIWVEWRVIPGRKPVQKDISWKPTRAANCGGTRENCRPCQSWRFESMEFTGEGSDFDGSPPEVRIIITEPNGSERKLIGSTPEFKDRPIYAKPGEVIRFNAYDEDFWADDPLGAGFINVQEFHRDGRAPAGRLTAIGVCEHY